MHPLSGIALRIPFSVGGGFVAGRLGRHREVLLAALAGAMTFGIVILAGFAVEAYWAPPIPPDTPTWWTFFHNLLWIPEFAFGGWLAHRCKVRRRPASA